MAHETLRRKPQPRCAPRPKNSTIAPIRWHEPCAQAPQRPWASSFPICRTLSSPTYTTRWKPTPHKKGIQPYSWHPTKTLTRNWTVYPVSSHVTWMPSSSHRPSPLRILPRCRARNVGSYSWIRPKPFQEPNAYPRISRPRCNWPCTTLWDMDVAISPCLQVKRKKV